MQELFKSDGSSHHCPSSYWWCVQCTSLPLLWAQDSLHLHTYYLNAFSHTDSRKQACHCNIHVLSSSTTAPRKSIPSLPSRAPSLISLPHTHYTICLREHNVLVKAVQSLSSYFKTSQFTVAVAHGRTCSRFAAVHKYDVTCSWSVCTYRRPRSAPKMSSHCFSFCFTPFPGTPAQILSSISFLPNQILQLAPDKHTVEQGLTTASVRNHCLCHIQLVSCVCPQTVRFRSKMRPHELVLNQITKIWEVLHKILYQLNNIFPRFLPPSPTIFRQKVLTNSFVNRNSWHVTSRVGTNLQKLSTLYTVQDPASHQLADIYVKSERNTHQHPFVANVLLADQCGRSPELTCSATHSIFRKELFYDSAPSHGPPKLLPSLNSWLCALTVYTTFWTPGQSRATTYALRHRSVQKAPPQRGFHPVGFFDRAPDWKDPQTHDYHTVGHISQLALPQICPHGIALQPPAVTSTRTWYSMHTGFIAQLPFPYTYFIAEISSAPRPATSQPTKNLFSRPPFRQVQP